MKFKKKRYFLIPLLLFVFLFLFISIYKEVEKRSIRKVYSQLKILADQTGKGIEFFFSRYYYELKLLSHLKEVSEMNDSGKEYIKDFYNISSGDISGITRVNSKGILTYTFPYVKNVIGENISYQEHIKYILKEKKPVLSDVFMSVQGFRTIAYHVPVFEGSEFKGSIAILIPFKVIAEDFLKNLKVGFSESIWMISKKGILLFSNENKFAGEKLIDFTGSISKKEIIKKMRLGQKENSEYFSKGKRYLVSYLPVKFGNTFWSIAVSISRNEALSTMKSFKNKWIITILFLIIVGFIYIYYMIKASTVLKEEKKKKKIINALKESEENFRMVVESSPVAIAIFDSNGKTIFLNYRFTEIFGFLAEEIEDFDHLWNLLIPDVKIRRKMMGAWEKNILTHGKNEIVEINNTRMITKKRGSKRIDIIAGNPEGKKIILFNDVTDKIRAIKREKKLHEELSRSKKMEALGLLSGTVAHDLNNILSSLVTYPELIKSKFPGNKILKKHIEVIEKAGARASAVVSDLLTVTRNISSKKKFANLNVIIDELKDSLEFKEIEKRFSNIKIEFQSDVKKAIIKCSVFHIEKLVINLVLNGLEAIQNKGSVIIGITEEKIVRMIHGYENISPGNYVVLSVRDNGVGLSAKDIKKIFDPFYSKKVLAQSGSGLGLTIVWNVAKDHEARINLLRTQGWTVFKIYFHLIKKKGLYRSDDIPEKVLRGDGETVLIIDDEKEQREMGRDVLETLGYVAHVVSNGVDALKYLKKNRVDSVLLDMIMNGGMGGLEIYENIIKIYPDQRVLIVSGFSRSEETEKILQNKNTDYLRKPYSIKNIGQAIKDLLQR